MKRHFQPLPGNPDEAVAYRAKATLCRITTILFAFTSGMALVSAYHAHQRNERAVSYFAQSVTYASLCVVFIALARRKAREGEAKNDSSANHPK